MRNAGQWFALWLTESEEGLRAVLRREGHDLRTAWDSEGDVFLAAQVHSESPSRELERLFVQAGVSGGFRPLRVSLLDGRPIGIELAPPARARRCAG